MKLPSIVTYNFIGKCSGMRVRKGGRASHTLCASFTKDFRTVLEEASNKGWGPLSPRQPLKELRDILASGLAPTKVGQFLDVLP